MRRLFLFILFFYCTFCFSQSFLDFYFKNNNINGAILIYDEKNNSYLFNNENNVKYKTPIGSFYNIINTLIALDLGVITINSDNIMFWDGVKNYHFGQTNPYWNCNTNLDEALQYKTDWYFQNLSKRINIKENEYYLKKLNLTNLDYNPHENYFWHFGNLKTTPDKQLEFLKQLKNQNLDLFHKKHQKYLYDSMLRINEKNYKIYAYETYNVYMGERIDWWIGVLETKDNAYYFSTRIFETVQKNKSKNFESKKFEITLEIFRLLGYI